MPLYVDTIALRRLLNERGMSLRDLSDRTGLSWTFVKYLANGQRNPRPDKARRIARALHVPVKAFLLPVTPVPALRDDFPVDDSAVDAPDPAVPDPGGQGVAA
jgi:transcriptional regulator with XRE-family HTH domain